MNPRIVGSRKRWSFPLARWLTLAALLLAACGGPAQEPVSIVVGRVATATGLATVTEPPDAELTTTPTATATTLAPTATLSSLRTKTPLPGKSVV